MNRRAALCSLLLLAATVYAEEPKKKPSRAEAIALTKAWVDAQRGYDEIPGLSFAVVHDQDVVTSGGSGFADPDTKRPATAETLYSICSVSKLFTAVALMQLRDEGKLALSDPVSKHLTWFTIPSAPEGGTVTVENILSHSSGLPRESDFPYWSGNFEFPTREQVIERIKTQSMLHPADTYFQYSNLGLTLAGEIVTAVAKRPYDAYVREKILLPLGLNSTYTDIPADEKGKRLAAGFSARRRDGTRVALPLFTTRGIAPAAGFASTVGDLARFASWQFRVLSNNDGKVLQARTLREMHRVHWVDPDFETYRGLGFAITRRDNKTFVGHGGSCPGYRTHLAVKPDERIGVAVMANASGVAAHNYAHVMYEIVSPAVDSKSDASDSAVAQYIGSYSEFPWYGETIFFSWGGGLASVSLPTMTPIKDMDRYRKMGEHEFRRIRKDDTLAETIVFEMGPSGRAKAYRIHSNFWPRME